MRDIYLKQDWLLYKQYRNIVVYAIRESKRLYYTKTSNDNVTNPKLLWKILKEITPIESSTKPRILN